MTASTPGIARKRFGQHFLEPAWVVKVVRAIAPAAGDVFFEIGPGRGALTRELTARAGSVTAFEIDRDLADALRESAPSNLTIVAGDFLRSEWIPRTVPVALSAWRQSPLQRRLPHPVHADRPLQCRHPARGRDGHASAGGRGPPRRTAGLEEMRVLSVLVQLSADVERLLALPAGAFRPAPKVQSALVRLRFHPPSPAPRNLETFVGLVKAIFTRRRKTLENALLAFRPWDRAEVSAALIRAGIDGRRRPDTLAVEELVRVADAAAPPRPRGGRLCYSLGW